MNEATLKKLKANPHYKLSQKQREELERPPMVEFGTVPKHNHSIPLHDVSMQRVARTSKNDTLETS